MYIMRVVLYGKANCPRCANAKRMLTSQKSITLVYKDIDKSLKAKDEYVEKYYEFSDNSVPVIVVGEAPFISLAKALDHVKALTK